MGLKDTITGDTLCDPDNSVILEKMDFPVPVIKIAVEPKTKADQEKMGLALNRLAKEDPSFRYNRDEETGQTTIEGMGELHLEIIVDRMKREFKVECNVGEPQVAYREAITQPATVEYTHKKQSGGSGNECIDDDAGGDNEDDGDDAGGDYEDDSDDDRDSDDDDDDSDDDHSLIPLYFAPIPTGQFAKIKVEFSPKDSEGGSEGEVEFISEIKGKTRRMMVMSM